MIKKLSPLFLTALFSMVGAQEKAPVNRYITVSAEAGSILGSDKDKSFGVGGTLGYMAADQIFGQSNNMVTLSLKAFHNPYEDGKFFSSVFNNKNDGMNYIALLGGYRFIMQSVENGWYIEPRMGVTAAASYFGFIASPKGGYTYKQWDFSAFADASFGSPENNLGKKSITAAGVGIGYNFKFH